MIVSNYKIRNWATERWFIRPLIFNINIIGDAPFEVANPAVYKVAALMKVEGIRPWQ